MLTILYLVRLSWRPWSRGDVADWPIYHSSISVLLTAAPLLTIYVHGSNRTCKATTFYFKPCVGRKLAHSCRIQQDFSFPSLFTSRLLRCTVLIDNSIMASSSRKTPINRQHISGIRVTGGRLFAGSNTTNNIHNGWYYLFQNIEISASLMLHSGPVNLRHRAATTKICMLVLGSTFILFSDL